MAKANGANINTIRTDDATRIQWSGGFRVPNSKTPFRTITTDRKSVVIRSALFGDAPNIPATNQA